MNKIDTTQATDPLKRQPFSVKSLNFLQNATLDAVFGVAAALVGDSLVGTKGYIFLGCADSGTVIDNGYFLYQGEIYQFTGGNYSAYSNTRVVIADTTNDMSVDPITFTDSSTGYVHKVRKLKLADQVSGTGLFDWADAIRLQDNIVRRKTIRIGDWDMDSTASVSVAHGLSQAKIRNISVLIINDTTSARLPLCFNNGTQGGNYSTDATDVIMTRIASGPFDNANFDSTSFNRGYITIDYVD